MHPNRTLWERLLPYLIENYTQWEIERQLDNGLFWQIDDRDGMEYSIGGTGARPTINSYMFGDANAISYIASELGQLEIADEFKKKAVDIKQRVQTLLWDNQAAFFKTRTHQDAQSHFAHEPNYPHDALVNVREQMGYTPWYFNLPDPGYDAAWKQLMDPEGFYAPFGPTTAEQRHPQFTISNTGHHCQWNGPSWPFATSVTLTSLANLLHYYKQDQITKHNYWNILKRYEQSHRLRGDYNHQIWWIDENLNPFTGEWHARKRKLSEGKEPIERGKDYNHSSFCDLLISGLMGFHPDQYGSLLINPLVPDELWNYFCLDRIPYKGEEWTIVWDKDGSVFNKRKGYTIYKAGKCIHQSATIEKTVW